MQVAAVTAAFAPLLRANHYLGGGRLVLISSVAGRVVAAGECPYGASKFAMEALADATRLELGTSAGIAVSLIEPGYVATPLCPMPDCPGAESPTVVAAAVRHAIMSTRPSVRYPLTNVNYVPTTVILWLNWALPDHLKDQLNLWAWSD